MEAGEKENVPAWVLFLPNEEQDYVMGLVALVGTLIRERGDLRDTLARVRPDIDPKTGYGHTEAI